MILEVPARDEKPWPSLGGQVCEWIEGNLVFGPGDRRGERAELDDEKRLWLWRMYEVYPRKHKNAGRRRFKRCAISVRKGLAKTEFAAWVAAAELDPTSPVRTVDWHYDRKARAWVPIGGPVNDPYIPLVAYTEEQSDELCYGALKAILEESEIADHFDIGLERIKRAPRGDGTALAVAGAPNARDGARTTFQVFDESHRLDAERLLKAHTTMLANIPKRKAADAWTLEITTAFAPGAMSVAERTMLYAQEVQKGAKADASLFFFHREAGPEHDLTTKKGRRAAVIDASGEDAAKWSDIDGIAAMMDDPTTDPAYWRRVWLNQQVSASDRAFDIIQWRNLVAEGYDRIPKGSLVTLGFDGAQRRDSTALVATELRTGFQQLVGLWERPLDAKRWRVPVLEVTSAVRESFSQWGVVRMYADPPWWESQIAEWASEFGKERVVYYYTSNIKRMVFAIRAFSNAIGEGDISHNGDKDYERHIWNAHKKLTNVRDEDGQGERLPLICKERPDSPRKIDAAMAGILSWQARLDALKEGADRPQVSRYAEGGEPLVLDIGGGPDEMDESLYEDGGYA